MKFNNFVFFMLLIPSPYAFSHSGGTDENGCHSGSQPYHCHNGGSGSTAETSGWDINFGYEHRKKTTDFWPYIGLSLGKDNMNEGAAAGLDIGFRHRNGFYAGVVSTSKSIQLGYHFVHLSANSEFLGLGLKLSSADLKGNRTLPLYVSGSVFFSTEEIERSVAHNN